MALQRHIDSARRKTEREEKVLLAHRLRASGWTQREIGDRLGTSAATVRKWLNNTPCEGCGTPCSAEFCRACVSKGPRGDSAERFFEKVQKGAGPDSCWNWTGGTEAAGYGRFWVGGRNVPAHRWSYEHAIGPIGDNLQIDHLCCEPNCVNPLHLEPVAPRVNTLRSTSPSAANDQKTHCDHGHAFSEENTYFGPSGNRHCRECGWRRCREYRARLAAV